MDDVARFASRLLVLNNGKLYMQGTATEIFAHDDELRTLGLDIPIVTTLLKQLASSGWDIRTDIVDIEQARTEIIRAWKLRKAGGKNA